MASAKLFLSCLVALVFFNIVFFIMGLYGTLFSSSTVIGMIIALGLIAVGASVVPTVSVSGAITWFMAIVMTMSILYSFSFQVLSYPISYGLGLCSNLANMFSGDLSSIGFLPWLFFNSIGLIGLVSGVLAIGGAGGD
jgi:hypothetical protein